MEVDIRTKEMEILLDLLLVKTHVTLYKDGLTDPGGWRGKSRVPSILIICALEACDSNMSFSSKKGTRKL